MPALDQAINDLEGAEDELLQELKRQQHADELKITFYDKELHRHLSPQE